MTRYESSQPKKFLVQFVGGSLVIIFASLLSVSLWFSARYVSQEQRRADLSRKQILEFFDHQYTSLAEEMWTRSLDSMGTRVAGIAKQLGSDDYEVFVADNNGRCLYHSRSGNTSTECNSPTELKSLISEQIPGGHPAALQYDEARKKNIYLAPLLVGSILKGYLFAAVPDPFDFYRGNFLSLALQNWLPPLLAVIIIWTAWLFISKIFLIDPYLCGLVRLRKNEALAHQAQQVAHDLKNPVATILSMTRTLKDMPEDRKALIRGAAQSIRDIANDLLSACPVETAHLDPVPLQEQGYLVTPLVKTIVAEATARFSEKPGVTIEMKGSASGGLVEGSLEPVELKRVLHNLIANAAEAINSRGAVTVSISDEDAYVVLKVADNGRGVPPEVLPNLGQRGASFGKPGGSGLGLFHARETMEKVGGTLDIQSEPGKGTAVTLKIPGFRKGLMFPFAITLPRGGTIAILDDERMSHQCWDIRLGEYAGQEFEVKHFYNALELKKWWNGLDNSREKVLLLCDYFLGKHITNGLEVIKELGAVKQAILVTGLAGDQDIQAECRKTKIRLLPKEQITLISLHIN